MKPDALDYKDIQPYITHRRVQSTLFGEEEYREQNWFEEPK